jgi:pimeloyl-ACP methyl ester carboxylesterase
MNEFFLQRWKYKLYGIIDNPESEKIVILVHGFTWDMRGPAWLFEKLSWELQKEWYAVCRFNCIGTPPSEGEFQEMTLDSEVEDTQEIISHIKWLWYKNISLLWESMGWSIITSLNNSDIQNLIFWYPAFDFADTLFTDDFLSKKAIEELEKNSFVMCAWFKVGKEFIQEISKIVLYDTVKNISCPVLFLHWDNDIDVPYTQSQKALDLVTHNNKKLIIFQWAGHCFPNDQERAVSETVEFLEKYA